MKTTATRFLPKGYENLHEKLCEKDVNLFDDLIVTGVEEVKDKLHMLQVTLEIRAGKIEQKDVTYLERLSEAVDSAVNGFFELDWKTTYDRGMYEEREDHVTPAVTE